MWVETIRHVCVGINKSLSKSMLIDAERKCLLNQNQLCKKRLNDFYELGHSKTKKAYPTQTFASRFWRGEYSWSSWACRSFHAKRLYTPSCLRTCQRNPEPALQKKECESAPGRICKSQVVLIGGWKRGHSTFRYTRFPFTVKNENVEFHGYTSLLNL